MEASITLGLLVAQVEDMRAAVKPTKLLRCFCGWSSYVGCR